MEYERTQNGGNWILTTVIIIAIVVVVVAILLPIFSRTHCGGRKSSCQSNLKELGTALALYHGDYDGKLPSSILYGGGKKWDASSFTQFASVRGTFPPNQGTSRSWPMVLYPHMYSKEIMWCPSDPNRNEDPSATRSVVSYYWKAAIDYAWYQGAQKEGDFAFPSDQIIFYERAGWHWGQASQGFANGVTINCTFLDGHVASKRIADSGYAASDYPPGPLPKSGKGEPAWFNCNFSSKSMKTNIGRNWKPNIWGDSLP